MHGANTKKKLHRVFNAPNTMNTVLHNALITYIRMSLRPLEVEDRI
jgi:hypothetical protein